MKVDKLAFTQKGVAGLRLPCIGGKIFVPLSEIVRLEGRRNYTFIVNLVHVSVGVDGNICQKDGFTTSIARRRAKQLALLMRAA